MKRWLKWFLILLPFGLVIFGLVVWYERRKKATPAAAVAPGIASFGVGGGAPGGSGGGASVLVTAGQAVQAASLAGQALQAAGGIFSALFGAAGGSAKPADLSNLFGLAGKTAATATESGVVSSDGATLADGSTLSWNGSEYIDTPSTYAVPDFSGGTDFSSGGSFGVLQDNSGDGWSDPGPISGGDGSANPAPDNSGGSSWSFDF